MQPPQVTHSKKLWTLFSASNFCGHAGNYGAAIEFTPDQKQVVHSHWAPPLSSFGYGRVVMELDLDVKRLMADIRKETSADVIRQIQLRVALHRYGPRGGVGVVHDDGDVPHRTPGHCVVQATAPAENSGSVGESPNSHFSGRLVRGAKFIKGTQGKGNEAAEE